MQKYFSLGGQTVTEKVIEKSRFITTSKQVCNEDQAKAFISEISQKYSDATHNCYAYICDNLGNFMRFSDDGEPQGTAGMPILEVIKNNSLVQTAVVVTRYFGGIKLGAGGLLRAYSGCAAENLAAAPKVAYEMCEESAYFIDYPQVDTATRYFERSGAEVLNVEYGDKVIYRIAVKKSVVEDFNAELLNKLNGNVKICKEKEYFYPFKT